MTRDEGLIAFRGTTQIAIQKTAASRSNNLYSYNGENRLALLIKPDAQECILLILIYRVTPNHGSLEYAYNFLSFKANN